MNIVLLVMGAYFVLNGVLTIHLVGKPRKPISNGDAVAVALMDAALTACVCIAAVRLG